MTYTESKIVKLKKDVSCYGCGEKILKSTLVEKLTIFDDDISHIYYCAGCNNHIKTRCQNCLECYELETVDRLFIKECQEGQR